MFGTN